MNVYTPHETGNVPVSILTSPIFSKTGQLLNVVPKAKNKLARHDRLLLFTLHILPLPKMKITFADFHPCLADFFFSVNGVLDS